MLASSLVGGRHLVGEHRWRAVRSLRWETIESGLVDDKVEDAQVITLIENLRRAQLTPLEEAEHCEELRRSGLPYEQIAKKVGKTAKGSISKGAVWKRVQLLTLTAEVLDAVKDGNGHHVNLANWNGGAWEHLVHANPGQSFTLPASTDNRTAAVHVIC